MTAKLRRMPATHLRLVATIHAVPRRWYHWLPFIGAELLRLDIDYHLRKPPAPPPKPPERGPYRVVADPECRDPENCGIGVYQCGCRNRARPLDMVPGPGDTRLD